jgi:hypothetical protein
LPFPVDHKIASQQATPTVIWIGFKREDWQAMSAN